MLGGVQPCCFLATRDPAAARRFYELGLPFRGDDGHALLFDLAGVPLRVSRVQRFAPASHTVLGWEVPDIAERVDALARAGVRFEQYAGFQQDAAGIWTAPDGTRVAWFKDPDGNVLSLAQH